MYIELCSSYHTSLQKGYKTVFNSAELYLKHEQHVKLTFQCLWQEVHYFLFEGFIIMLAQMHAFCSIQYTVNLYGYKVIVGHQPPYCFFDEL